MSGTKRTSQLISALCQTVLLFTGSVVSQVKTEGVSEQPIKCSIKIDAEKIVRGRPLPVEITIENVSGSELDLDTVYSFELLKIADESVARKFAVRGDSYWSPFDIVSGNPLGLKIIDPDMQKKGVVVGRVPEDKLRLGIGEVRTYKVELTKLYWNDSILSGWPADVLFDVVPKGRYWLELRVRGDMKIKKEVKSNRVEVTVG